MNYVTLYHGTSEANLPSIMARGLRVSRAGTGGDHWARRRGWNVAARSAKHPSVYATTDRAIAEEFAQVSAEETGSCPVVLTIHVSRIEFLARFVEDDGYSPDARHSVFRTSSDIPADWITGDYKLTERWKPFPRPYGCFSLFSPPLSSECEEEHRAAA